MKQKGLITLLLSLVLCGCAKDIGMQQKTRYASLLANKDSHLVKYLNEDRTIHYMQNFGGSIAIDERYGARDHQIFIGNRTKADAKLLYGKIKVDPIAAFNQALNSVQMSQSDLNRMAPYMLISKRDDHNLYVSAALLVTDGSKDPKLAKRYFYQLPRPYPLREFALRNTFFFKEISEGITEGYKELLKFHLTEWNNDPNNNKLIRIESDFLTPRIMKSLVAVQVKDTKDRVWIDFYNNAVYALIKDDISKYEIMKKTSKQYFKLAR